MKVDIPEFKKCCCCIPLRPGLIGLGYLKLLASLFCLGLLIYLTILVSFAAKRHIITQIMILLLCILLVLLETSLTIVFLVGSHKKNHKLIRIYYYYSIVVLCLYILAYIVSFLIELFYGWPSVVGYAYIGVHYIEAKIATGLLNSLIQLYVILLIRSEVIKLKNNAKFRFSNHAATESQCQMESDDVKYKNNIINEASKKESDSSVVNEKNIVEEKNKKNVNMNSDDKLYLNKYMKMKNEE